MARQRQDRDARASQRPQLSADRRTRLYIPPEVKPQDKEWRWVAESVHNAPNDGRVESALQDGWTPVDASKYPDLRPPSLPGREKTDNLVRKGGQILMEIDKWKFEERLDDQEAENAAVSQSISTAVDGPGMSENRLQVHANQTKFEHRRPIKQ